MKKSLTLFVFTVLFAANAFATYVVVLKDGTRYNAKAKWTVVNGKALVHLENGQSLQLDPALIDVAKSEQLTKLGLTGVSVIDLTPNMPTKAAPKPQSSLSGIKLRQRNQPATETAAPATTPAPAPGNTMSALVVDKFHQAFENIGIFERKITPLGPNALRAEVTADTEPRVFNAISATSFLMVRNAFVDGARLDTVELFMKTTTGGSAGRFQMSRADAEALVNKTISQQEYFIRNVIY